MLEPNTRQLDKKLSENHESMDNDMINRIAKLIKATLEYRPSPIRTFDQIHMRYIDSARHLVFLSKLTENKEVVFMGDSDGIALCLTYAGELGLLPSPKKSLICDFDERTLQFIQKSSKNLKIDRKIDLELYNVFDPIPSNLIGAFDFFHTNPPFGQFNNGKSIIAFIERAAAMVAKGGEGVIILANDARYSWTMPVLRSVLTHLLSVEITPYRIMERLHRYHLDDQPELESGIVFCKGVNLENVLSSRAALPDEFKTNFYGRQTIPIPHYIRTQDDHYLLDYSWDEDL